ncbi:MAG: NAD(P)H-hydrate dehydratase, partial [Betaproteobacteria bacterium]
TQLPLVLDADALNLVAQEYGLQQRLARRRAPALLTPHPAEAARLMGSDTSQVQQNRLSVAAELAARFNACVILKGSGSVVAAPDGRLAINTTGNPALATAGSGDVLAGLCGALLAQQHTPWEAALAAVWLHGAAADQMVADGMGPVGVTAGELLPYVRNCLNRKPV